MSLTVDWKCLYEGMGKCREELKMENNVRKLNMHAGESFIEYSYKRPSAGQAMG